MYARLLALVGLLFVSALSARADAMPPLGGKLAVFLRNAGNVSPRLLEFVKRETEEVLQASGIRIDWLSNQNRVDVSGGVLAVVDMRGSCGIVPFEAQDEGISAQPQHLGATEVADGKVLPFSSVDCDAVWAFVGGELRREFPGMREFLFGRALGRVLAHELYHVVAQTEDHSHDGTAKAAVSATELLASRFHFDSNSTLRLRQSSEGEIFADDSSTK